MLSWYRWFSMVDVLNLWWIILTQSSTLFSTRGIRQSDHILPYIFTLCSKVLKIPINNAKALGLITNIPISRGQLCINHIYIYLKIIASFWQGNFFLVEEIDCYSRHLWKSFFIKGQIKKKKTSIHFNINTSNESKESFWEMSHIFFILWKIPCIATIIRRCWAQAFKIILDSMKIKISNWKTKLLSQASKEIWPKLVIQARPTYNMGVFKLPRSLLKEINRFMNNFDGEEQQDKRKIH